MNPSLRSLTKIIGTFISSLILGGCMGTTEVRPGDPYYQPTYPMMEAPPPASAGSLFQAGIGMDLYSDQRAARVGDIITVVLEERTVSQKSSSVGVTKESDIGISGGGNGNTILGTDPSWGELGVDTNISSDRDFNGGADADQSNSLQGNISVTVANVLPNGNLIVRGEKWITLNRGDEYIRISGIVRPQDITQENSIISTKLANAKISYSETGELSSSQQMGWMSRFFNSPMWPL